jgi:hypothetical protein
VNFELKILYFINNAPFHICLNDRTFLETNLILWFRSDALSYLKPFPTQRFTYGNNTGCYFHLLAENASCSNRFRLST